MNALLLTGILSTIPATPQTPSPDDAPRVFQLSASCARCHDASDRATALKTEDGGDASPHGLWRGTMMAQSFFDPYWRAKMAREVEVGALERGEVEQLCLRCHAPAASHHDRLVDEPVRSMAELLADPAAQDGVTCTTCHRMTGEGLGQDSTFGGMPPFDLEARLYGPYPDPVPGPMRMHTGYEVTYGPHMVRSSVCATCHTLTTQHAGHSFPEQSPYFEWRNSVFSYEDGLTEESRSCQACHMPDQGSMRIAHNPGGRDFPFLSDRPEVRGHRFVGGNAFMLELMADHADELGVQAPPQALRDTAAATRQQLSADTASIHVERLRREGETLRFEVRLENHTGHKLPTGYPGRRVWIEAVVEIDGTPWFASGVQDESGRIARRGAGLQLPHRDVIRRAEEVQVYELVAHDEANAATTHLTRMATRAKDNRLLPRGWRADGPHALETAPMGIADDGDFVGGSDRVHFELPHPPKGSVQVRVRALYQAVPPHWVDDLRESKQPEATRFVELYDSRTSFTEVLASASAAIGD